MVMLFPPWHGRRTCGGRLVANVGEAGAGEVGGQLVGVHAVVLMLDVGTPSGLVQRVARAMPRRSAAR
jgi:hypothetical protein